MDVVPLANWNGEFLPLDKVFVPALDRAFLFGDAVYEAMRVYEGRIFLAERHFARLARSLQELRIVADVERIRERTLATLHASQVEHGLIYIQVTRGAAPQRAHAFPSPAVAPNELIYVSRYSQPDPHGSERERGVAVVTFPDLRWARRDVKTVNLLGNCLAAQAAKEAGAYEALLVEPDGRVTEGAHTSVFAVKDGRLRTHSLGPHILPGVTRGFLLELAASAGVPVHEEALHQSELDAIDELFLTGTSTEVLGVTRIDSKPVGSGTIGTITRRLADAFTRRVREWLQSKDGP